MPTLHELNTNSYNALDDLVINKLNQTHILFNPDADVQFIFKACVNKFQSSESNKLTEPQNQLLSVLKNNRFVLIPKNRLVGETLAVSIYLAIQTYFHQKNIIIYAPNSNIARNVLDIVRFMIFALAKKDNYDMELDSNVAKNKRNLILSKNNRIMTACQPSDIISHHADIFYMTEAGQIHPNYALSLRMIMSYCAAHNSQVILSSCYNGEDSFFYSLVAGSLRNENQFKIFPMLNYIIQENDQTRWPIM